MAENPYLFYEVLPLSIFERATASNESDPVPKAVGTARYADIKVNGSIARVCSRERNAGWVQQVPRNC